VTKTSRHAWLSSEPLSQNNVHERCNLGARQRWGIEAGFLVEKHQGYHYEHAFALDWNAMQGYHLLMRLAHVFNTLARFTRQLRDLYQELGVRGAIAFIRKLLRRPLARPSTHPSCSSPNHSCFNLSELTQACTEHILLKRGVRRVRERLAWRS
jgi:hypothetical protein